MSIQRFRQKVSVEKKLSTDAPTITPWVRNPTWLPMPSTTSSDERVDMLVTVYPESNYIAFTFNTSAGTYHVVWGDGSTDDVASGTAAQHLYSWSDTDLDNTDGPVTFTDSGDTVDRTAHGYTDGMTISFATIVSTTGISAGQIYYVVNATANTFQVSATLGGSAIALTTDGSGTILPYKQAIISVTPNTGGATFSTVNLQVKNTTSNLQAYVQPILDLTVSANCSTLSIGGATVPLRLVERVLILRHNSTSMGNMFSTCSSLQSVPLFNTAAVTNMNNMFLDCTSLQSVPLFNTAAVTSMNATFSTCSSLQSVPLFNTAAVTNMGSLLFNCTSLQSVPLFNTAAVTNMNATFRGCSSLQSVPLFNTAAVTNMLEMFENCTALQSVPLFNTAAVTNFGTAAANGMFNGCTSLQSVPLFNTSAALSMGGMFNGCTSLQSVPLFNTAAATGTTAFTSMFSGCTSLQQVPDINFNRAAITTSASYTTMFSTCSSLSKIGAGTANNGPKFTFTVANCKLSATALDTLYTSLPSVTSQTITVSGNVGIAADTPSIATGKGWTVTGS